jgi:cytochrome c-type biogenesis protein CcmH/NrfG
MMVPEDRDLAEEIERLSHAVKSNPSNFDLWKRLGKVYQDNSEYQDAIEAFSHALEIKPGNADIVRKIEECERDLKYVSNLGD